MTKIRTLQLYRGTEAQNDAYTGSIGELTMDTTNNELRIHDGSTAGGHKIGGGSSYTAGDGIDITSNIISATGVKNKNTAAGATNPVYDWVGTLAEYTSQAVATNHPEWVCYITDDVEATAYQAYTQSQCNNLFVQKGHQVIEFQAPTAVNNYTWYRKYADGWVEQGGIVNVGGTTGSITLAVEMADTNYQVMAKVANANISGSNTVYNFLTNNYTTTGFGYRGTYNNGSGTGMPGEKFFWEVKGMAA